MAGHICSNSGSVAQQGIDCRRLVLTTLYGAAVISQLPWSCHSKPQKKTCYAAIHATIASFPSSEGFQSVTDSQTSTCVGGSFASLSEDDYVCSSHLPLLVQSAGHMLNHTLQMARWLWEICRWQGVISSPLQSTWESVECRTGPRQAVDLVIKAHCLCR